MFENLLSIETLLAVSVGAIFSFKIRKVNIKLSNNVRNQSPVLQGDHNLVIYNQAMNNIKKEMAFSVKVCTFVMIIIFHMLPVLFVRTLLSLSIVLPVFCIIGVVDILRLNGFRRGWDILYPMASVMMGVIFYCSAQMMINHLSLYPQLPSLYNYLSGYRFFGIFDAPREVHYVTLIIFSSVACPALIISGLYLTFASMTAREGNDAFRYSAMLLGLGYVAYLVLSGGLFSPEKNDIHYFISILTYPFVTFLSLSSF